MRQSINVNPGLKEFEAYMDFSGGLNTETSNERLLDNEFTEMVNVDLKTRGSVKKRTGRVNFVNLPTNATPQGMFLFYREGFEPDLIYAIDGKLYKRNVVGSSTSVVQIPITNSGVLNWTFQTTRIVEAVQYYDKVIVATGSGLVVLSHNGTDYVANGLEPYQPNSYEITKIGVNSLLFSPMVNTVVQTPTRRIKGILFTSEGKVIRFGVARKLVNITAYVERAISDTMTYEFYIRINNSNWITLQHFSSSDTVNYTTGDDIFDIKVTAKFLKSDGSHETADFIYNGFEIKTADVDGTSVVYYETSGINNCNRILLHWGRLMLYGDTTEPTQIYFSDYETPEYFPSTNTLRFDTGKQESITSVVRIQDYLSIFSKTSIFILSGKSPADYVVSLINDTIGCVAPHSAVLTGNVVTFLSEEGVFILKPSTFKLDQLNVQRVDTKIKAQMLKDTNACALNHDSQYWLCFPDKKLIYRYYYEQGVWVKDVSENLDIIQFLKEGSDVYNLSKRRIVYKHDGTVYYDGTSLTGTVFYEMKVETKYFDLSKSFNFKKLKRLYVLGRNYNTHDVNFYIKIYADSDIVLNPESGQAVVDSNDVVIWKTTLTPNVVFNEATVLGSWNLDVDILGGNYLSVQKARIRGKCRRVKLVFTNTQSDEVELFGFGLEFKLKKP